MNFIAIDFETANQARHSACSIALVMVEDSQVIGHYYSLIKPDSPFSSRNVQIHGIQPHDVAQAPSFPEVWQQIQLFFQPRHLIVAHNASFDCNVLKGCLDHYQLPPAHFQSLCTVQTSRKLFPTLPNHKLNTVAEKLDIQLDQHHHALADSLACAEILLRTEQLFGTEPLKKLVKQH